METVVQDQTPLANYLIGEGEADQSDSAPERDDEGTSLPSSPTFAPTGRPTVRSRFRSKIPDPLHIETPSKPSLRRLRSTYSSAVASRIDRADNAKFLEQFRYTIVASQLLSGHSILGQYGSGLRNNAASTQSAENEQAPPEPAALAKLATAVAVAFVASWLIAGGYANLTMKKVLVLVTIVVVIAAAAPVYFKRQYLKYRRDQAVAEVVAFVANSQDFDSAAGAALALIQEVELVSRGYRISAPLPPISRIEDRSQSRKCVRLRKALKACFAGVIQSYGQATTVVKGFSEQTDLDKYYDIYDISDLDISDALQGFAEGEFEDPESLRTLKILAARFHTIRKIFLCALLALDANGDTTDLLRWTTAYEALRTLNGSTEAAFVRLKTILGEEESFPSPSTPKVPLTPGRERWRSQLRKLNSLSTGIRGLQAKLQLLREESDRALNESSDISELGTSLMAQYDSIGVDLKDLIQAWEEGKAALVLGIDRNEKRLSSMSGSLLSPTTSLSGLTTVEEGGALEALKALNGESRSPSSHGFSSPGDPDAEEIFEAVALPRPRSLFTREERIAKMKEERERKEVARERAEANRGMLKELEMVINLRPRAARDSPARIASL